MKPVRDWADRFEDACKARDLTCFLIASRVVNNVPVGDALTQRFRDDDARLVQLNAEHKALLNLGTSSRHSNN